jgi:exodeoxyribonuclease V beta subunit
LSVQKEQTPAGSVTITNYGTQKIPEKEDESEKDHEAILFGTALHYTLEMLSAFDEESLWKAMNALQNRYGQVLTSVQTEEIRDRVLRLINDTAFKDLLKGATLSKEQSLSYKGELKQIDLLLEYDDRYVVIDYKSSKKFNLKHQNQVNFYTKAIEKITGKPTEGVIVYLLGDEIEVQILN